MIKTVYTVKDTKVGIFLPPFMAHTDEQAVRDMTMACNDANHPFAISAETYALYKMGAFDDVEGKYHLLDAPEHMVSLDSLVVKGD